MTGRFPSGSKRRFMRPSLTLAVPRARTKTYGDRCFPKAAALLWNSLPASLRDTNSIASFQRGLKTFLFRQEFENAL